MQLCNPKILLFSFTFSAAISNDQNIKILEPVKPWMIPPCLQPPPQKLLPEHAQTLERYAWESFDPHSQGICRHSAHTFPLFFQSMSFYEWVVQWKWFLLFSDVPAWERLPAPAVCGGEFQTLVQVPGYQISRTKMSFSKPSGTFKGHFSFTSFTILNVSLKKYNAGCYLGRNLNCDVFVLSWPGTCFADGVSGEGHRVSEVSSNWTLVSDLKYPFPSSSMEY